MNDRTPRETRERGTQPFRRTFALDVRQVLTSLVLMVPAALVAIVTAYFAAISDVQALVLKVKGNEQSIDELKKAGAELQEADRERAVQEAQIVARIEAIVERLDDMLRRLERLEAQKER